MTVDLVATLGTGATGFSVAAGTTLLLQVRTMRRRRSSRDVSLTFLAATSGGYLIWLLYGLAIDSIPLVVSDAVGLVGSLTALGVAVRLRRRPTGRRRAAASELDTRAQMQPGRGAQHPPDQGGPRHGLRRRLLAAERVAA